jgi:predicted Zn-dependent protease
MENKNQQNQIFTDDQIQDFAGFFNSVRKVHYRLISEGYSIEDGQITKPSKDVLY